MAETYYERLGVTEDATTAEIKRAYRERLKRTHPDVSDDEDASDRTKRLIEAKEVLLDEDERGRYDRLGHDQYVRAADGNDQSWADESAAGETTEPGSGDTDGSPSDATSAGRERTGTAGARASGWSAASRESWGEGTDASTGGRSGTGDSQRSTRDSWRDSERRRARQQTRSDSSANPDGVWRTWETDAAYSVGGDGGYDGPSLASGQSLVLLCATFLFYPLMLGGALSQAFPLVVNVVLAACVLLVVAYLQSIPTVGVVVFGTWSVLVPVGFVSFGLDLFSPLGLAALAGTVLPLGLSVLTRAVIQP